jgi:3-hydroxyisobutyrate dehydrogenase
MGTPMARRLIDAGFEVHVWNRDRSKAAAMAGERILVAESPEDVVRRAPVTLMSLLNTEAVCQVAARITECCTDRVIVDTSTTDPNMTREIAGRLAEYGLTWLDIPVSGGVPGAESGSLIMFAGGPAEVIDQIRPVLAPLSRRVSYMGQSGAGQITKIFNQMIVAVNLLTIAETVALAQSCGVDAAQLAPALAGGFADSVPLQLFATRMATGAFEPRETGINLMTKDLGFAQRLALEAGAAIPMSAVAHAIYRTISQRDDIPSEGDVSNLVRLYQSLSKGKACD